MPKNIVILCDGTTNTLQKAWTNVAWLKDVLADNAALGQTVTYDPGVGTEGKPGTLTAIGDTVTRWADAAVATSLLTNVEQAYLAVAERYVPGDQIYLFGFSRGAYTARVLAGLIQHFGILKTADLARAKQAVREYREFVPDDGDTRSAADFGRRLEAAANFRSQYSNTSAIRFVGVFDTVSSVGWAWNPKMFSGTGKMPDVSIVRHAMALDERRAKFRPNRVTRVGDQDVKEVWFAGCHSDIGGGHKAPNDRLPRVALRWMLREATTAGIKVDTAKIDALKLDVTALQDATAAQTESLTWYWWPAEYLLLPYRKRTAQGWSESRRMYRGDGWRRINASDTAHASLQSRLPKNPNWPTAKAELRWEG